MHRSEAVVIMTRRPPPGLLSQTISFWLPTQFKGSGPGCLLKLVKWVDRNEDTEWETGAKVKPECYNYSCEAGPGCLVQAPRRFSSAVQGVTRDREAAALGHSVHIHQLCGPGCSSAADLILQAAHARRYQDISRVHSVAAGSNKRWGLRMNICLVIV